MADEKQGEVIIEVDIDSKGFDKGTIDVEKAIKSLEDTMNKAVESMSKSIGETLTAALKNLDGQIEQTNKNLGRKTNDSSMLSLENNVQKAENKVADLNRRLEELGKKETPTEEYKEISKQIQKAEKDLNRLIEKSAEMQEAGRKGGKAWEENESKIEQTRRILDDAKIELNELVENGKAFTLGSDTSQYERLSEQLKVAQNELEIAKTKFEEFNRAAAASNIPRELDRIANEVSHIDFSLLDVSQYNDSVQQYAVNVNKANLEYAKQENLLRQLQAQLEFLKKQEQTPETENKITELENKIQELTIKLQQLGLNAENAENALENAVEGSKVGLGNIVGYFKKINFIPSTLKKISSGISRAAKGFINIGKAISTAASKLNIFNKGQEKSADMSKKLVKQFTRIFTMVKSRIVRSFVSSLFSGITEGIKELAKADDNFNKRISELKSKFSQLKFAIMSAFAPLITYVTPIITKLMDYVTGLVDKIAQLTAALTGQNTYKKAVYNYSDYAKSLDDTKDSTDDLADSTKELNKQLAAFDKLNVLNTTSDTDTNSSLLDNKLKTTEPVYTEVSVGIDMSNLSKRIKEAFSKGDFTKLGEDLGKKINNAVSKIDSTKIGETIAKIINSASSFAVGFLTTVEWGEITEKITSNLNKLIEDIDAKQLGHAVGEIINTAFEIGFTFFSTFDFAELGIKVADFLNGIIDSVDKKQVAETIAKLVNSIVDIGVNIVDNLNWKQYGAEIADIINTIFNGIDWKEAGEFVSKTVEDILDMFIVLIKNLDGREIGASIKEFLTNIDWTEIGEKLADLFWEAIVCAKDIVKGMIWGGENKYRPAYSESGRNLADGIPEGIKERVRETQDAASDLAESGLKSFDKTAKINSPSKEMEERGEYLAEGLNLGIQNNQDAVILTMRNLYKNIQKVFIDLPNWLKNVFSTAWNNVKNVFSNGGTVFNGIKEGILSEIKYIVNKLIDGINTIITIPFNGINSALDNIRGFTIDGFSPFGDLPYIDIPQMPHFATGTVVPANYGEFAAILGDNKREPEVVSPISAIEQAVENVLNRRGITSGFGSDIVIPVEIDGREVFRAVKRQNDAEKRRHGGRSQLA